MDMLSQLLSQLGVGGNYGLGGRASPMADMFSPKPNNGMPPGFLGGPGNNLGQMFGDGKGMPPGFQGAPVNPQIGAPAAQVPQPFRPPEPTMPPGFLGGPVSFGQMFGEQPQPAPGVWPSAKPPMSTQPPGFLGGPVGQTPVGSPMPMPQVPSSSGSGFLGGPASYGQPKPPSAPKPPGLLGGAMKF